MLPTARRVKYSNAEEGENHAESFGSFRGDIVRGKRHRMAGILTNIRRN
jgi:hypothetical protein